MGRTRLAAPLGRFAIGIVLIPVLWLVPADDAEAQRQAISISRLTTPAAREGSRLAPPTQLRPSESLQTPEEMRIKPPFAWNRSDRYEPPSFESFFPDDPEGGKQLDALFSGQLGGNHSADDVLAAVRRGLRHTKIYPTQILSQVGNGFVWNAEQQDPRAIELLYHASDPSCQHAHQGMYYGLCVLNQRTPNVMRAIADGYTRYGPSIQNRIPGGFATMEIASRPPSC